MCVIVGGHCRHFSYRGSEGEGISEGKHLSFIGLHCRRALSEGSCRRRALSEGIVGGHCRVLPFGELFDA